MIEFYNIIPKYIKNEISIYEFIHNQKFTNKKVNCIIKGFFRKIEDKKSKHDRKLTNEECFRTNLTLLLLTTKNYCVHNIICQVSVSGISNVYETPY